jgi:hypothetical protein
MIITKRRRQGTAAVLGGLLLLVLGLAGWSAGAIAGQGTAPVAAIVRQAPVAYAPASSVPVLVYHEMNNGCAPTAPVCQAKDPETVSTAQFTAEMNYLARTGHHTVTLAQYEKWLGSKGTLLPARPVLITADNGIGSFLQGAQPVLARYGFTAVAFLVSGFADGASRSCGPGLTVSGKQYNVQAGCPAANVNWDLTWPQIEALSPAVWSFALEAGPSGHFVQDYDARCRMFDACQLPGEAGTQYKARVAADNSAGLHEMTALLKGRVNTGAWVVPYSDLGYRQCAQDDCTPQQSDGPKGWLAAYAKHHFTAVFVEDAFRNGQEHERFRFDVNGSDTEQYFEKTLAAFTRAGDFSKGNG